MRINAPEPDVLAATEAGVYEALQLNANAARENMQGTNAEMWRFQERLMRRLIRIAREKDALAALLVEAEKEYTIDFRQRPKPTTPRFAEETQALVREARERLAAIRRDDELATT